MLNLILCISTVVLIYFLYFWVILPRKLMTEYARMFKNKGYKVVELPFNPFTATHMNQIFKAQDEKKDALYHNKH